MMNTMYDDLFEDNTNDVEETSDTNTETGGTPATNPSNVGTPAGEQSTKKPVEQTEYGISRIGTGVDKKTVVAPDTFTGTSMEEKLNEVRRKTRGWTPPRTPAEMKKFEKLIGQKIAELNDNSENANQLISMAINAPSVASRKLLNSTMPWEQKDKYYNLIDMMGIYRRRLDPGKRNIFAEKYPFNRTKGIFDARDERLRARGGTGLPPMKGEESEKIPLPSAEFDVGETDVGEPGKKDDNVFDSKEHTTPKRMRGMGLDQLTYLYDNYFGYGEPPLVEIFNGEPNDDYDAVYLKVVEGWPRPNGRMRVPPTTVRMWGSHDKAIMYNHLLKLKEEGDTRSYTIYGDAVKKAYTKAFIDHLKNDKIVDPSDGSEIDVYGHLMDKYGNDEGNLKKDIERFLTTKADGTAIDPLEIVQRGFSRLGDMTKAVEKYALEPAEEQEPLVFDKPKGISKEKSREVANQQKEKADKYKAYLEKRAKEYLKKHPESEGEPEIILTIKNAMEKIGETADFGVIEKRDSTGAVTDSKDFGKDWYDLNKKLEKIFKKIMDIRVSEGRGAKYTGEMVAGDWDQWVRQLGDFVKLWNKKQFDKSRRVDVIEIPKWVGSIIRNIEKGENVPDPFDPEKVEEEIETAKKEGAEEKARVDAASMPEKVEEKPSHIQNLESDNVKTLDDVKTYIRTSKLGTEQQRNDLIKIIILYQSGQLANSMVRDMAAKDYSYITGLFNNLPFDDFIKLLSTKSK